MQGKAVPRSSVDTGPQASRQSFPFHPAPLLCLRRTSLEMFEMTLQGAPEKLQYSGLHLGCTWLGRHFLLFFPPPKGEGRFLGLGWFEIMAFGAGSERRAIYGVPKGFWETF